MTTTTNYGYNVVEGTDQVNIQTQIAPNFTAIDSDLKDVSDAAITTATHTLAGTVHQLVRNDADRSVIRFVATADMATGDTFTVDGVSVTARLVNGEALKTGSFKINNCVECILVGSVLNINAINPSVSAASDVTYDNTGSGLAATNVQDAIDEVKNDIPSIPASYAASAITYNNVISGLSATDVQAAIDELKSLITTPAYITTGLEIVNGRCNIVDGGYYEENGNVYIDIYLYTLTSISSSQFLVKGFPSALATNGTMPHNITPAYNGLAIMHPTNADPTVIGAMTNLAAGTSIHYVASYAKA